MTTFLGWTPFIDPLHQAHGWWIFLIVPLTFGIAMIYKAYRLPTLERYWRQVTTMTVQVLGAFLALAIALFIVVQIVVPMIPSD